MRTIYDITGDYMTLLYIMEDPEIDAQAVADTMDSIEGEFEDKAEAYAKIITQVLADAEGIENEASRLIDRAAAMKNKAKAMKEILKAAMEATGKTKFKTELFTFGVRNNGGKTPIIYNVAPSDLPEQFRRARVTYTPDDEVIRAYLDNGNTSDCFRYGERGTNLQIR